MATHDAQITRVVEKLDQLLSVLSADSENSGWAKALKYLEDIAAVVGNLVAHSEDNLGQPIRAMRVSLESIFLQDPRDLRGLARFTRSIPIVFVDATTKSAETENVVPTRNYKAR